MIVENQAQLAEFLESRLTGAYAIGDSGQPSAGDAIPVKSYLLEARQSYQGGGRHDPPRHLERILSELRLRRQFPARVHGSRTPELFTIQGPLGGKKTVALHLDCRDERFWVIHTVARSHTADWIIGRMARTGSGLTRLTFPDQLLEMAIGLGELRGAALAHDRRPLGDEPQREDGSGFMSMQIWGGRSSHALEALRREERLQGCVSLSRVQIRYRPRSANAGAFVLDDIDMEGRLEARGTSVDAHLHLVQTLRRAVRRQIDALESRHGLRADRQRGRIQGALLTVRTARPIADVQRFCELLFSGSAPFRLWGIPAHGPSTVMRVRALDLETTGVLDFGIGSDFIRIGLPRGTSGSAVLRFFANVQRHLDSRARLLDEDGRDVIDFRP